MSPGDITITTTHREVMRRLDRGESLTLELAESLGALYLHELVDDVPVEGHPFRMPGLTDLGRRVLDVHGEVTRRTERPRLESRQLPPAWEAAEDGGYTHRLGGQVDLDTQLGDFAGLTSALLYGATRDEVRTMGRDLVELIDWLDHEERVRAQGGAS